MSLKVWLPLLGNPENKGSLLLPQPSINTLSYAEPSIISNVSATGVYGWHFANDILDNSWSVCSWVYPVSLGTYNNILFCKNSKSSDDCQIYFSIIGSSTLNVGVNGPSSSISYSYTFAKNAWYHVAATYDGTKITLYLNGSPVKTGTVTTAKPSNRLNVQINGRSTNDAGTGTTGNTTIRYNDFRLYDHCLSDAEVREISKGLVRHYKFEEHNLIDKGTLTRNYHLNSSGGLTGVSDWYVTNYIPIYYGKTYQTFDLSHGGSNTYVVLYSSSKAFKRSIKMIANENLTITPNEDESYIRLSIRNLANELSIAKFVEIPNIIFDSSGYDNHASVIGTITVENSSPKYNCAIHMNNKSSSNHIEANPLPSNVCTISLWVKATKSTAQVIVIDKDCNMCFGLLNSTGVTKSNSSTTLFNIPNFVSDAWNHVVVIKDGSSYSLYVNGVEQTKGSASNNYVHNVSKLYFLNRNYNNSYGADASISNFRAYTTILSDKDILRLYEVEAKVASEENIHTDEFVESGGRELMACRLTNGYSNHSSTSNLYTGFNDGIYLSGTSSSSVGSEYIKVYPTGSTYYYDVEYSVNAGNQFYIGFARFDANKTSRSNEACAYILAIKPSADVSHARIKGTVNLATDGVNPTDTIALRVLNGWSGSTSGLTHTSTIHRISLREVTTPQVADVTNEGQIIADTFIEADKASFYKNGKVEATAFIEM